MNALPKPKRDRDEKRLDFVRKMPCLIWTHSSEYAKHTCGYVAEAHHVYDGKSGGTSRKPDDSRTVPLCKAAHEEFHRIGKDTFQAKYGLDLEEHIQRINREYRKLHPPLGARAKRVRQQTPRIGIKILHCFCGRTHEKIPLNKVSFGKKSIRWYCIVKREYYEAEVA